jgi:PTH1 family peptidyl-tRNA hydrolase
LWVIAGLGNPGRRYAKTRHNVGFMVVNEIAERYSITFREKEQYQVGKGSVGENNVILMEPLTFMNRSGSAVLEVMKKYALPLGNLIIVHDDIDMETGNVKIRKRGSSGGHKGVESIIQSIGAKEFIRVKIGIGREEGLLVEDYVLSKFRKEEVHAIKDAIMKASDAVACIVKDGVEKAMNNFNKST